MGIKLTGFDELLEKLDKLSDKSRVDEIAKKAVEAATPAAVSAVKSAVRSSEYGPRSTGSVAASITGTAAKINNFGVFAVAKPTGYDAKGRANAYKATMLENGNVKIAARPWRGRAVSTAEPQCVKIMEEIIKSEMGCD
jgi:hypothetical protein